MNDGYREWRARPLNRPDYTWTPDGQYVPTDPEPWVAIAAPDGRTWEVLAAVGPYGEPVVETLLLRGTEGSSGEVTPALLRQQPLTTLARIAVAVVEEVEALRDAGSPLDEAMDEAAVQPGDGRRGPSLGKPSPVEFTAVWREEDRKVLRAVGGGTYGLDTRSTRQRVAQRYGKSLATIDKWLREFRDDHPDLIPKKKAGRPRLDETTADDGGKGTRPRATKKKEK